MTSRYEQGRDWLRQLLKEVVRARDEYKTTTKRLRDKEDISGEALYVSLLGAAISFERGLKEGGYNEAGLDKLKYIAELESKK